jgi:hypothetical protein
MYSYLKKLIADIPFTDLVNKSTDVDDILILIDETKEQVLPLLKSHEVFKDSSYLTIEKIQKGISLLSLTDELDSFTENKIISNLVVLDKLCELARQRSDDVFFELHLEKTAGDKMSLVEKEVENVIS